MKIVTIEEAQTKLVELVEGLGPGEEMILTRDARPFARVIAQPAGTAGPSFGRGRGMLTFVSEDDDHLEAFEEYMQ